MSRHSELRFETGQQIAKTAIPLLTNVHATKCNSVEITSRLEIQLAVSFISNGDITELSRKEIYGAARVIRALVASKKGRYSAALELYGDALEKFAGPGEYVEALRLARESVELAKAANLK